MGYHLNKNLLAMKNNFQVAALFAALLIGIAVAAISCGRSSEKQQEDALENAIEQGGNANADVDIDQDKISIETDEGKIEISNTTGKNWPEDAPDIVPEFRAGTITGITRSESDGNKSWMIRYEGVPEYELDKYNASLKVKGFKTMIVKSGKGGMVNGNKDNVTVIMTIGPESGAISISQQAK